MDEFIVGNIQADLTILMDIDPEIGLQRIKSRGQADRIEQESIEFFKRITQTYRDQAKLKPSRYAVIDASQSISVVKASIKLAFSQHKERLI